MKKIAIVFGILMCVFACFSVQATSATVVEDKSASKLIEIKEKGSQEIEDYIKQYDNNETYGWTAFILGKIRILSIPCCFIGIAVGAVFQYVIGIRKLDVRDRGFLLIIAFTTILVICQVLPLVFAIVVKGFGNS